MGLMNSFKNSELQNKLFNSYKKKERMIVCNEM